MPWVKFAAARAACLAPGLVGGRDSALMAAFKLLGSVKPHPLRAIAVRDLIADYDAVMSSERDLIGLMEPDSDWPRGMTLEEDLIDWVGTSANSPCAIPSPIRCWRQKNRSAWVVAISIPAIWRASKWTLSTGCDQATNTWRRR